jgi:hypothetical protein
LRNALAVEIQHIVGAQGISFVGIFDVADNDIVAHVGLGKFDNFLEVRGEVGWRGLSVAGDSRHERDHGCDSGRPNA